MVKKLLLITGHASELGAGAAVVVVAEAGVVVALLLLPAGRRVWCGRRGALLHDVVVLLAVESAAVPERELVARNELPGARTAPETLDVVDLALGPHHEVVLAERRAAFVAFRAEQPAKRKPNVSQRQFARVSNPQRAPATHVASI